MGNNSSFLRKKDFKFFTTEANNLTGKNSFRYSGLAQKKVVGLEAGEKGVVLTTKSTKGNSRKPAKLFVKSTLNKDIRRVAKSVNACSEYRPDLERVALARASALFRAKRAQEIGVKPPVKRTKGASADDDEE